MKQTQPTNTASTGALQKALQKWMERLQLDPSPETRKAAREAIGLIFVKEFTVKAHFRKPNRRRPVKLHSVSYSNAEVGAN